MWHAWGTGEVHTGFWWGNLMEGEHIEGLGVDGKIIKYLKELRMVRHGVD